MIPIVSYYYDAKAENKLQQDFSGYFKLDFGEEARKNPPIAGVSSAYTSIYVRNEHPDQCPIELVPKTLDTDLKITEYPDYLEYGELGKVTLAFSPSADRIKPLEGGSWGFDLIIYPKVR